MDDAEHLSALEGIRGRTRADQLVSTDPAEALKVARSIRHPWYRCQALSSVARNVVDPSAAGAILASALSAANEQLEPNRIISISSWPLSLLVHIDRADTQNNVDRLLAIISKEPHSIRRADGLLALLGAIHSDQTMREQVLSPLISALRVSTARKTGRLVRALALMLAVDDRAQALEILNIIPETREIRQARRLIGAGEHLGPPYRLPGHEASTSGAA